MSINAFWLPLLAISALAQTSPPPQLEAVSSGLHTSSHSLTVTLVNHSRKKVVAYAIEVRQFDAAGKPTGEPLVSGTDNVFSLFYGENAPALLAPGAEISKQFEALSPEAVTAKASVVAVFYLDRTAEGDPKQIALLRKNRAMHAQHAGAAAELLAE